MASKSYTLLEYLVTIEMELKKLKKIVAESVGADYSELITQINGIGQELNSFKSSITDTVNTNNSEITSKFNSLEQQFNTFKTNISNTVNSNKTEITSQVNTLNTNFNDFKTSIESQVSSLNTRVTSVERRVTTLENSGGSSGGSVDLTEVNSRINNLETKHDSFESSTKVKFTTINSNISKVENNFNSFKNTTNSNIESINTRVTTLENNSGSSTGGISDGYGEKLITKYVHSGNQEIHFSSFDFATGQGVTTEPHGLTEATEIIIVPNDWTFAKRNNNILSIPVEWVTENGKIKVVPVDDITLKVTKSNDSTIISVNTSQNTNAAIDITKFHFEVPIAWTITNIKTTSKYIRFISKGYVRTQQYRYIRYKLKDDTNFEKDQPYITLYNPPLPPNTSARHGVFGVHDITIDYRDDTIITQWNNLIEGRRTTVANIVWDMAKEQSQTITGKEGVNNNGTLSEIRAYSDYYGCFSNGTVIYLYSKGD